MAIALGSLLFWATMSGLTFLVTASDSDTLINEEEAKKILEDRKKELDKINISPGPIGGKEPTADTLRWPADGIDVNTDYVFFQFGKYIPPFGKDTTADSPMIAWNQYQASTKLKPEGPGIVLPMPQDLSNESAQTWQGKQFSAVGRAAVAALAGGNMSFAESRINDFGGNWKAIQTALTTAGLNKVPGVGGNLTMNDVSGSTRGIVLNPNAELLYDSPQLREIGMTFKMVPRNLTEAQTIDKIVKQFRSASMPSWGLEDEIADFSTETKDSDNKDIGGTMGGENFIHVPQLCKFTFMTGNKRNPNIAQFKPCGMARVQVNYTPDGTYATYDGGDKGSWPVATELQINFTETKIIFRSDVKAGF
tara:strand:+ start:1874 stop:2965 length:1092 start_codon:yes stop_codon:yes gene_type:complete